MSKIIPTDGLDESVVRYERVVSFNIRMYLTAQGHSQRELADFMEIKASAVSMKLTCKTSWSLGDLVKAAAYLHVPLSALTDDTMMVSMGADLTEDQLAQAMEDDAKERNRRVERRKAAEAAEAEKEAKLAAALAAAQAGQAKPADVPAGAGDTATGSGPRLLAWPVDTPAYGRVPRMRAGFRLLAGFADAGHGACSQAGTLGA